MKLQELAIARLLHKIELHKTVVERQFQRFSYAVSKYQHACEELLAEGKALPKSKTVEFDPVLFDPKMLTRIREKMNEGRYDFHRDEDYDWMEDNTYFCSKKVAQHKCRAPSAKQQLAEDTSDSFDALHELFYEFVDAGYVIEKIKTAIEMVKEHLDDDEETQ